MRKYIFTLITATVILLSACTKADGVGDTSGNAVYMGNPNNSGVISMIVNNESGGSTTITPRLAQLANEPVTITVSLDEMTLNDYNLKYNLSLEPIDVDDFVFVTKDGKETTRQATATIEKGDFKTGIEVKMKSVNEDKYPFSKRFAIPVIITSTSKHKVLSSPKTTIIRINRKLKTSVGLMSGGNIKMLPKTQIAKPMTEWTFQMSMIYSTLTRSNLTTAYITNHGGGEFYTRINQSTGIQVKNGRDGNDTWTQKSLSPNVWLHISYVYREGEVSVYVNGELQKTFETTPMYINNTANSGWVIGNEGYNNDYIREVRFWNKALSEAEIIDKLYLPQDPEAPGLLMYLPITVETELEDITGNWNVTKGANTKISYVENVIFPAEKLEIEE